MFVEKYFTFVLFMYQLKWYTQWAQSTETDLPFHNRTEFAGSETVIKTPFINTTQYAIVNRETNSDEIIYLLTEKKNTHAPMIHGVESYVILSQ